MIVEERIYRIRPRLFQTYLTLVRDEGLGIQKPVLGNLIGYFTGEIGPLCHVVHMWGYESLDDRTRRRAELAARADWQAFTKKLSRTIETMENRILLPTDFSPLR